MRIIINKIIITPQHREPASFDPLDAPLVLVELVEPLVEEPVSLRLLEKFVAINLLPQFPQNIATSLFS